MFKSTKHYGHEVGLSAVFRQWRAASHCNQLHGYALAVTLTFGADKLDSRNWVVDFGALKPVKSWLQQMFDHKMLVAEDDPKLDLLLGLDVGGVASAKRVPAVGCEAFAALIYDKVDAWLPLYISDVQRHVGKLTGFAPRGLHLISVEVREHGANSAVFAPQDPTRYNI